MLGVSCRELSQHTFAGRYNQSWTRQSLSFEYSTIQQTCTLHATASGKTAAAVVTPFQLLPRDTRELWLGNWVEVLALLVVEDVRKVPATLLRWSGCDWKER